MIMIIMVHIIMTAITLLKMTSVVTRFATRKVTLTDVITVIVTLIIMLTVVVVMTTTTTMMIIIIKKNSERRN